jgi:hypothetical protein
MSANHPFVVDENNIIVGVTGQRFAPKSYTNFNPVSVVPVASTFSTVTSFDSNSGNVRLNGTGAHGLTTAVVITPAINTGVYVTWTAGSGVSGVYPVTAIDTDTTGTKLTINLPYVSGTATFSTSSSTVATVTFSSYNLVSGQTTVLPTYNSPVLVNWTSHGRKPGDTVQFATATSLPTGLATSTTYYVSRVIDANSFTITDGPGGTVEIVCTSNGSGTQTVIVTPTIVTWTAHGRSVGDQVRFTTTGSLPTGFSTATTYYVNNVISANSFTLSASAGGASILATAVGSGTHTCIFWYGTAAVKAATEAITLASFTIEGGLLSLNGNMECNALFSMTSAAVNKVLEIEYASNDIYNSGNLTTTTTANVNKIVWARGAGKIVTGAASATGHGTGSVAYQEFTVAYGSDQTFVIKATIATANNIVTLEGYQVTVE